MFKFIIGLIIGGYIVHTNTNILNDYKKFVPKITQWNMNSLQYIHPNYRSLVKKNIIFYS